MGHFNGQARAGLSAVCKNRGGELGRPKWAPQRKWPLSCMPAWHGNSNPRDWMFWWFCSFLSFFQSRLGGGKLGEQLLMGVAVTDQLVLEAPCSILPCDMTVGHGCGH